MSPNVTQDMIDRARDLIFMAKMIETALKNGDKPCASRYAARLGEAMNKLTEELIK